MDGGWMILLEQLLVQLLGAVLSYGVASAGEAIIRLTKNALRTKSFKEKLPSIATKYYSLLKIKHPESPMTLIAWFEHDDQLKLLQKAAIADSDTDRPATIEDLYRFARKTFKLKEDSTLMTLHAFIEELVYICLSFNRDYLSKNQQVAEALADRRTEILKEYIRADDDRVIAELKNQSDANTKRILSEIH